MVWTWKRLRDALGVGCPLSPTQMGPTWCQFLTTATPHLIAAILNCFAFDFSGKWPAMLSLRQRNCPSFHKSPESSLMSPVHTDPEKDQDWFSLLPAHFCRPALQKPLSHLHGRVNAAGGSPICQRSGSLCWQANEAESIADSTQDQWGPFPSPTARGF